MKLAYTLALVQLVTLTAPAFAQTNSSGTTQYTQSSGGVGTTPPGYYSRQVQYARPATSSSAQGGSRQMTPEQWARQQNPGAYSRQAPSTNYAVRQTTSSYSRQAPPTSSRQGTPGVQSCSQTTTYTTPASSTAPAKGTQNAGIKTGNFYDSMISSGMKRTFHVHIPRNYDRSKQTPLVMVFHGLGLNGGIMENLTQMDLVADRDNFITVYPDGLNARWDDGARVNTNDLKFVEEMIGHLSTSYNIDRRRVYAAGYSNGGHFAMYMACQTNLIAAMAIIGSGMVAASSAGCRGGQVPTVFFIGTSDPLVPSTDAAHTETLGKLGAAVGLGGMGSLSAGVARMGGIMTAEETCDFWATHNGVSTTPYTQQLPDSDPHDGTTVTKMTYGGNQVVYYRILGGGHTWPGAIYNGPSDVMGAVSHDIDASEIAADFFLHH